MKFARVKCVNCHGQPYEGDNADDVGWHDVISWEEETGNARRDCHRQKSYCPSGEQSASQEAEHGDISRKESNETYRDMKNSEYGQDHKRMVKFVGGMS